MLETLSRIELSSQILNSSEVYAEMLVSSDANQLTLQSLNDWKYLGRSQDAEFPISNDPCTGLYFDQLQVRATTPEYRAVKHPVALLIGESALAANLRFIPEPTIIMADYSPGMCNFLSIYIDSLKAANSRGEWIDTLINAGNGYTIGEMRYQDMSWNESGYPHPFSDDIAFTQAQALAREKTVVPWNLDIMYRSHLDELGQELRRHDAGITFMNLSNVIPFVVDHGSSQSWAEHLGALPITPNAPILTTTIAGKPEGEETESMKLAKKLKVSRLEQTGPFFGLDNLGRAQTGFTYNKLGAITTRRYASDATLH
jgi:hypothetical protein